MENNSEITAQRSAAPKQAGLHVLWHWVIMTAIMTALIGGAALVF